MISFYRIGAVVFRHLMTMKRVSWFVEVGYWIALDIIIFGSLGKATAMMAPSNTSTAVMQVLITNAVLWYLVLRGALTIGFTLLNELFDMNFIALFATPLRTIEWIISAIIVGTIAALVNVTLGWIIALLVFDCNIFALGTITIALAFSLLLSGWMIGLLLMSVLLWVGKKGTGLAFAICLSVVPFSCVYYPLDVFPVFLQKIVVWIPMAQIFTAIRTMLMTGVRSWRPIIMSLGLNVVYLALAALLFIAMFKRSKKRGLARLELEW